MKTWSRNEKIGLVAIIVAVVFGVPAWYYGWLDNSRRTDQSLANGPGLGPDYPSTEGLTACEIEKAIAQAPSINKEDVAAAFVGKKVNWPVKFYSADTSWTELRVREFYATVFYDCSPSGHSHMIHAMMDEDRLDEASKYFRESKFWVSGVIKEVRPPNMTIVIGNARLAPR